MIVEKTAHSSIGASSAYRWIACPGSVRLSLGIPNTSSGYAKEGTAAHELAAKCLRGGTDAAMHIGSFITVEDEKFRVTDEMAEAVQVYLDTIREDLTSLQGCQIDYKIEQSFNLDWLRPNMFGTNDCIVGEFLGTLRVYDYKHGRGVVVDSEDNAQTMYYGLGAGHGQGYEEVELIIVQPRAQSKDGPVRRCLMTMNQLERWGQEVLLPAAKATENPEAPLCAGEHCGFCPARPICPKQREAVLEIAQGAFDEVPSPPPDPETLDFPTLKKVADASNMIESWLKSVKDHIRTLLETGKAQPIQIGYKFVQGRASRSWTDEKAAEEWLSMIVEPELLRPPSDLISPAKAEALLKDKELKKSMADLVSTVRGKQLVALSDPRPMVEPAIAAFSDVPTEADF